MLAFNARALERASLPERRVPRVLAWKFAPTLAHEIRHAVENEAVIRHFGANCARLFVEDEIAAEIDAVATFHEMVGLEPSYWAEPLLLDIDEHMGRAMAELKKGLQPFAQRQLELYPAKLSLWASPRSAAVVKLEAIAEEERSNLAAVEWARKAVRDGDEARREEAREILRQAEGHDFASELADTRKCLALAKDEARFVRFKDYFLGRVRAREKVWLELSGGP